METQFKVLTQFGDFIDAGLLVKGLYVANIPHLYSKDETIESIEARYRSAYTEGVFIELPETFFRNLKNCSLELITLTINNPPTT